jgi:hypothetical protein
MVEVERAISKFPNVCTVYDITGLTDMIIIAKFRNHRELSNFVKRDLALPSIKRTNSHMVLVTVKEDFGFLDMLRISSPYALLLGSKFRTNIGLRFKTSFNCSVVGKRQSLT